MPSARSPRYYISTGALNCYYTLRYIDEECVRIGEEVRWVERDYHVCSLSTDQATAIERAKERVGKEFHTSLEVRPIDRRKDVDWSVFQAGDHTGRSIFEVAETHRDYLLWAIENLGTHQRYAKTIALARPLLETELRERESGRSAKERAEADRRARIQAALAPLADELADGRGKFCDGLATEMRAGHLPKGRAKDIVLDVLAKGSGRRNSKGYQERFEQLATLFDSLADEALPIATPTAASPARGPRP